MAACCLALALAPGCTKSPTDTAKARSIQNQVAGSVTLEDFLNPAETFVWLEGFDLGTRADEDGGFSLQLPDRGEQSALPGGVEGLFKLYFFNANYFIKTLDLVILNGEFVVGRGDLLTNGDLNTQPTLANIVAIRTESNLSEIRANFNGKITVSVRISPVNRADTVNIVFPGLIESSQARIFIDGIGLEKSYALTSNSFTVGEFGKEVIPEEELTSNVQVRDRPIVLNMEITWRNGLADPGEYEILPYLLIDHQEIPPALLANLGVNSANLLEAFRNIPFGVHAAKLNILPAE